MLKLFIAPPMSTNQPVFPLLFFEKGHPPRPSILEVQCWLRSRTWMLSWEWMEWGLLGWLLVMTEIIPENSLRFAPVRVELLK